VAYTTYKLMGEAKCWWQNKKAMLAADFDRRLPLLGTSLSTSSIGISFPKLCSRQRHESFWSWFREGCQ
jgi:hypothetical protein